MDRITVATELQRLQKLQVSGGIAYLMSLEDSLPQVANLDSYMRILKERALLRRTIHLSSALMERCYSQQEGGSTLLMEASRVLAALGSESARASGPRSVADIVAEHPGGINAILNPAAMDPGIPTPWNALNHLIGGLRPGQLVLVAARPNVGKSAMATQIALDVAKRGPDHGVLIFTLEMAAADEFHRMLVDQARIDFQLFRHGQLDEGGRLAASEAAARIAGLPIWIDDRTCCSVPLIESEVRKLQASHKLALVIVDYLQLMTPSGSRRENRNQDVAEISRGLKLAARTFNLPFLVLAQLNRGPEIERRRPRISDLRDSGELEQDADVVILMHADDKQDVVAPVVEFIVAKQRQGPKRTVRLRFHGKHLRFAEPEE